VTGPCPDGEFGIVLFGAATENEALGNVRADPAAGHGLKKAELHNVRLSLPATEQWGSGKASGTHEWRRCPTARYEARIGG
jgi:hypothetical protein